MRLGTRSSPSSASAAPPSAAGARSARPCEGLGIVVKVGIHAGEVESDDRTMSGLTVFTGARITGAAQPGEVLVSNTVKELVAGSSPSRSGGRTSSGAAGGMAALYARRTRGERSHVISSPVD